ncbi:hypothetical protein [Aureimonas sp. N4]|uniref:hypothetical protein n=1 Tax=Aureimonas sp. N4 TaxID=1638165 RepID=UPI000781CDBE|nr:hypothetical protein [Aureimonas sp. N4]
MLKHINPTLKLPDGRLARDIASEGDAERIINELSAEVTGIETQITSAEAYKAVGRRVDLHWLYRARQAARHRKEVVRAIRGALKVMRREEHQRREAIRLAAGPETPEQKRQRVELANAQHETDCALFVAEMRERLPRDEYLAVWKAVHAKKAEGAPQ